MSTPFAPILITSTPSDVVRGWIGQATRSGIAAEVVPRMADALGGTLEDVHAIARGSLPHLGQLLDGDLVQRLAGSVGASPLDLAYRSVLRYDSTGVPEPIEDDEERAYLFVMSEGTSDRTDYIVEQDWDLREFNRNPVAFYDHRYGTPPVGFWRDLESGDVVLTGWFVPTPVPSHPLSLTVASLMEAGALRGASVGFKPTQVLSRASLPEEDPRYHPSGLLFRRPILTECSLTPRPANAWSTRIRAMEDATNQQPPPTQRSAAPGLPWSPSPLSSGLPWT